MAQTGPNKAFKEDPFFASFVIIQSDPFTLLTGKPDKAQALKLEP